MTSALRRRIPSSRFQFAEPVTTSEDSALVVVFRQESSTRRATLGRFRLALSAGPAWPDDAGRGGTVEDVTVDQESEYRGSAGVADARHHLAWPASGAKTRPAAAVAGSSGGPRWLKGTSSRLFISSANPELASLRADVARLEAAKARLEMAITRVMVSEAMPAPRETRVLPRGNWMDDSGAVVEPAIPEFLGVLANRRPPRDAARPRELAGLAAEPADRPGVREPHLAAVLRHRPFAAPWVTSARKANGRRTSICSTGSPPSSWSRRSNGSRCPRVGHEAPRAHDRHQPDLPTVVDAATGARGARIPGNRLLARQSRLRVEAEVVRDLALQVSGLLVEKFGGPSVRPYQPEGYLAALNYPRRAYSAEPRCRLVPPRPLHALAAHVPASELAAFDAPSREEHVLDRITSEHAAAGPRPAERSDLRRGRAQSSPSAGAAPGGRDRDARIRLGVRARPRPSAGRRRAAHARRRCTRTRCAGSRQNPAEARAIRQHRRIAGAARASAHRSWRRWPRSRGSVLNLHEMITRN